jgi:hypothetical protein
MAGTVPNIRLRLQVVVVVVLVLLAAMRLLILHHAFLETAALELHHLSLELPLLTLAVVGVLLEPLTRLERAELAVVGMALMGQVETELLIQAVVVAVVLFQLGVLAALES